MDERRRQEPDALDTGEIRDKVRHILADSTRMGRNQPLTRRIFEVLAQDMPHVRVGKSIVRNIIEEVRTEMRGQRRLPPPSSRAAQVTWGRLDVILDGRPQSAQLFIMTLGHSRRTFVMAFPAQNPEAFLEGHARAFEYFGGVPHHVAYADMRAAARRSRPRVAIEEGGSFKDLRTYYRFELRQTPTGRGQATDRPRRALWRRNPHWAIPSAATWDELNAILVERCREQDALLHPDVSGRTVAEVFPEEKPFLRALPAERFPCCKISQVTVDSQSRVRYNRVLYSVPGDVERRRLEVRAYYSHLEFYEDGKIIARWSRSYQPWDECFDFRHYLQFLWRNPLASISSRYFRDLPDPIPQYRQALLSAMERREAGQTLSRVLLLLTRHPEGVVLRAIENALQAGTLDSGAILAAMPRPGKLAA